ncbi:GNAT family N-acetyltransferase [Lihuaxuella thermophila]|uniref:Acetyltransferase (GNAT) family protein n=1 Tax=Lihuaxuella thermophila TaxID=1173111 RepID=A0A1H8BJY9_9BACL|nr:GNAT family N-acetyltransferase [Lihuaxuella thermophila]SEM83211.1 Acetyltransferase (GNAT) family protein [Lihuaxuella thermophila]
MISFRSLSECTWREAVETFNRGFEGYVADLRFDEQKLIQHMARGDLSPGLSLIACYAGKPAGIVLNGIRRIGGKLAAWNGGTGVAKEFRGLGIGKALIEKSLEIYRQHQVEIASLEAMEVNQPAITLYGKMGYVITDRLHFYSLSQTVPDGYVAEKFAYPVQRESGREIIRLPFRREWTPWQTQLASLPEAESVIIRNEQLEPVGYALFQEKMDQSGQRTETILYQCETVRGVPERKRIIQCLLSHVFRFPESVHRQPEPYACSTFNLLTDPDVLEVLQDWGFEKKTGQVWMERTL